MNVEDECRRLKVMHAELATRGRTTAPMVLCFRDGGRVGSIVARRHQDTDKEQAYREMFGLVAVTVADEALFVADSYISMHAGDTDLDTVPRAKHDPGRVDALQIMWAKRADDAAYVWTFPYLRDRRGRVFWLAAESLYPNPTEVRDGLAFECFNEAFRNTQPEDLGVALRRLRAIGHSIHLSETE